MLNIPEKIVFAILAFASLTVTGFGVRRLINVVGAGQGKPEWRLAWRRFARVLVRMFTFQPVFRSRLWTSLFHAFVGWGFGFYILVNLFDAIQVYVHGFAISGILGNIYRLLADVLSVAVLLGMAFFVIRRFIIRPADLSTRSSVLVQPKARNGIKRDSAIVAGFILLHVGARFAGASLKVAAAGQTDGWQPFANVVAGLWSGWSPAALVLGEHIAFWLALGTILVFLPYFPYSKHIHLFFAPLNYLLKPERRSMGEMSFINLEDQTIEQFGVAKLADLGWEQLTDAYACIMCFRCQDVCPAYVTGKVLSPSALEINKRYLLNSVRAQYDTAQLPGQKLTDTILPPEAAWACVACGACVDICPVGDEPMRDILDIRRNLVLVENVFPKQLETAWRNVERTANPWGVPAAERMKWAEGLSVPTIEQNQHPEFLWWVGCTPATDARAQKTARAFAKILNTAGVNYAVLGQAEQCTGDSARRAGREDIFFDLAQANVATLNEIRPKRIVTTCPHCLNTLKNEYPAFGGNYQVLHHSQLMMELTEQGKLESGKSELGSFGEVTYHDPCYLGRQNGIMDAPRQVLRSTGARLSEMPHHGAKSFCCGAGGAQMWKEEEQGTARVSETRLAEAQATGAGTLAVGCPFCLTMLTDAAKAEGETIRVMDLAEIVAERLE